jgi:putative transcriptional regulator
LWKVFYIFKRFWCFLLFILKFIKKIIDYDFRKINKGQLLIAEPSISGDLSFNRSVILLADHDEGSVGFIINKPLKYTINDLLPEINASLKFIMVGL